ncbi:hypothetical protein SmJEL517_g01889 [Synchytrium microbalum]|uniref:Small ribosomal subunit protein bS18m n=1 Tax=Synchytrium microbalum TaxID=1806994 RepID=A0A507CDS2_9FUNG|nr:uncharacterized protein SmJEL517_g01889 [Synchytrium microbalum]TPX35715.1 hypothetical protein SmJEL517_g01889 [Synchytrium microbalum]
MSRIIQLPHMLPSIWHHTIHSSAARSSLPRLYATKAGASFQVPSKPTFGAFNRLFSPGETYEPADLNASHIESLKQRTSTPPDYFAITGKNPLDCYKDVQLLSNFVTAMGHIAPRYKTGLSITNQRRVAVAIRRARALGLMAYTRK